jgi:hypothetical protein
MRTQRPSASIGRSKLRYRRGCFLLRSLAAGIVRLQISCNSVRDGRRSCHIARRGEFTRRMAEAHGLLTIPRGWQSRSRRLSFTHELQRGAVSLCASPETELAAPAVANDVVPPEKPGFPLFSCKLNLPHTGWWGRDAPKLAAKRCIPLPECLLSLLYVYDFYSHAASSTTARNALRDHCVGGMARRRHRLALSSRVPAGMVRGVDA